MVGYRVRVGVRVGAIGSGTWLRCRRCSARRSWLGLGLGFGFGFGFGLGSGFEKG